MKGTSNVHGKNCISHNNDDIIRPLANFSPNLWGDVFLYYTSPDSATQNQMEQEISELKEEVKKQLTNVKDPKESLILINAIQKLGVAYCFEEQIEAILQHFHNYENDLYKDDLQYASLRFRLLRQHGFFLSTDLFNKFMDENGSFKNSLKKDLQGMLGLYEASHVRIRGEKVLEEALAFTTTNLTSMVSSLRSHDPLLGEQITHALDRPFYKCTNRLEAKFQIPLYELDASHNQALLRLAKLDFNMLQSQYKKELSDLIRWARSLDFTGKFPFSRELLAESYIWALGVCYEPQFSYVRTILIKVLQIMTVINDTYDAYGTIQELEPFTDAILRWDSQCKNQLPDYMKMIYQILLDTFQDFEQDLANGGRSCAIDYVQRELKNSCQAYLQEARWCNANYTPPYDEYMKNGMVSSIYALLLMAVYQGMGEIATKDELEWIYNNSNAMKSSCILARLWADMGGHKFERKRKHVDSAVECYMASFDASEEEAYKELQQQVEEAWMDLKEEMLRPTAVSMRLLTPITNMCRALYDMYKIGEDAFNMPITVKHKVQSLLIDPAI